MNKKIVMLTAWDFPTAKILDEAEVDYILVGDSLSMAILGHKDTKNIGMDEMLHHLKAVVLGAINTTVIADMPIRSYSDSKKALLNAKKFIKTGAEMVKIEGNKTKIVEHLVKNKIKVVGHLGLLPQTAASYKVQGRDIKEANKILNDAVSLEKAGIKLLILECIPVNLAKKITGVLKIPTIGIGAGKYTTGQVLVLADVIGLTGKKLKMAKQYVDVKAEIAKAVEMFKKDVSEERFPADENSFI